MEMALKRVGTSDVADAFTRHDVAFTGVRRMFLIVACSDASVPWEAAKAGAAAINAVAAAPIMADLRTGQLGYAGLVRQRISSFALPLKRC